MTTPLLHDLVVCTRNRPDDLRRCLESVAGQLRPANVVRIIDASDPDEAAQNQATIDGGVLEVAYEQAPPSTTAQRNLGVDRSSADIVHFIDDDTVLEPAYFAQILAVFEADRRTIGDPQAILGVGGLPTNLPDPRPSALQRRLLSRSAVPGSVLASGRGVLPSGFTEATEVEWLSGCAMSFRREVLLVERFDEGLVGYALGEDLDLSYRVHQHGRLIVEPTARLEHLESPRNRWDRRRMAEVDLVHRRKRVASGNGDLSVRAYWLDAVAQLGLWSARSLRPNAADARATSVGIARGMVAAARSTGASPAAAPSLSPSRTQP